MSDVMFIIAKRTELNSMLKRDLLLLANARGIGFNGQLPKKEIMAEKILSDMIQKGDMVAFASSTPGFTGPWRDILGVMLKQSGVGTVLTLLRTSKPLWRIEKQDPAAFWKQIFQQNFPEYDGVFDPLIRNEWKKLCLWMTWAHVRIVGAMYDFYNKGSGQKPVFLTTHEKRNTQMIKPAQFEPAVPIRVFALAEGFWKGRLCLYGMDLQKAVRENPEVGAALSFANARHMDALRLQWFMHIPRAYLEMPERFVKFRTVQLREEGFVIGDAQFMEFAVRASERAPIKKSGMIEMLTDLWDSVPDAPRKKGSNLIVIGSGCSQCGDESKIVQCSECKEAFCSDQCGEEHLEQAH